MKSQIAQSNNLIHKTKIQNGAPNNCCWCIVSFRMKLIGISLLCFAGSILYRETIFDIINSGSSGVGGVRLGKQQQSVINDGSSDQKYIEKKISPTSIEQIILLGERHSGTNWITDYLIDCFGDEIKVRFEWEFGSMCVCISCVKKNIAMAILLYTYLRVYHILGIK